MAIYHGQADRVDKLGNPFSVAHHEAVMHDHERFGVPCTRGLEGLFHVFRALHFQGLDADTYLAGCSFDFVEMRRDALIREVADPREMWERLVQQFQAFASSFR